MVNTHANTFAGFHTRTALANNDAAGSYYLTAKALYAKTLAGAISASLN
jgi:hypothetical protein